MPNAPTRVESPSRVTAVVVTYHGERWIESCVQSLIAAGLAGSILVIDNGSSEQMDELLARYPDVEHVRTGKNLGFGRACNVGARRALARGAEFVLVMNMDLTVQPDTVRELVAVADEEPGYGILAPVNLNYDGTRLDDAFVDYMGPWWCSDMYLGQLKRHYPRAFMLASIWLVRRAVFETVGGFDPAFFMYGEDRDLCARLRRTDWQVGVVTSARAHHHHTNQRNGKRTPWQLVQLTKAELIEGVKRPDRHPLVAIVATLAYYGSRAGFCLLSGRARETFATMKALGSVLLALPRVLRSRKRSLTETGAFLDDARRDDPAETQAAPQASGQ